MARQIVSVAVEQVDGGVRLIARSRSDRGTPFIVKDVLVFRGEKSGPDYVNSVGSAVEALLTSKVQV